MKKNVFLIFALLLLSCNNHENEIESPDGKIVEEEFFISSGLLTNRSYRCEDLKYNDRIGYDFETAYDSVVIIMKWLRPDIYLQNTVIDTIVVDYNLDNRDFIRVEFRNESSFREIYCVLDTHGNYFDTVGFGCRE